MEGYARDDDIMLDQMALYRQMEDSQRCRACAKKSRAHIQSKKEELGVDEGTACSKQYTKP